MNNHTSYEKHTSVLLEESIAVLQVQAQKVYVDATIGGGGHSLEILSVIQEGTLVGFDLDTQALERFAQKLQEQGFQTKKHADADVYSYLVKENIDVYLVYASFSTIDTVVKDVLPKRKVQAILADLGWSSEQLGNIHGLSYQENELLDMYFGQNGETTAADLLQHASGDTLTQWLQEYADFTKQESQQLVIPLLLRREDTPVRTTYDLVHLINEAFPQVTGREQKRIIGRVFQALRIAVNDEFTALRILMQKSIPLLDYRGRLVLISFHSGEEKIIEEEGSVYVSARKAQWIQQRSDQLYYAQPVLAELKRNIRSRSAKLWVLEKQ